MNRVPDAAESNAGDDFHLLWAARRALRLLDLNGWMKGVRVEGPNPKDAVVTESNDGDSLLGIDLTEYFGGTDFRTADRVTYSQLKYSTRRADQDWTAAKLVEGKNAAKPHNASVIHRLSQAYKAHLDTYGRDIALSKLSIQLISNRSCSAKLTEALAELQLVAKQNSDEIRFQDACAEMHENHQEELKRLRRGGIGLTDSEFVDFVRVIDVSECGTEARLDHDLALVKELGEFGFLETSQQYDSLKGFIHRRMMPENSSSDVMTVDDIVPVLGVPRIESLFPAEARFERLEDIVARSCLAPITKSIVEAGSDVVCVHGSAGTGKTTLVRCMLKELPPGSVLIVFDCYGGGSYLDPAEIRHKHSRAVMQICNELAGQAGTGLLLRGDAPPEDLLREFLKRFGLAARLIRSQSPEALVVLAVDAADNCVSAAKRSADVPFVYDLARSEIPEGCRVVFTTRSHRISELQLDDSAIRIEVPHLELHESESHLLRFVPHVTETEVQQFHHLSDGIPRVQRYALADCEGTMERVLRRLLPETKTVESIIEDQLREADRRLGEEGVIKRVFEAALTLPRPIPVGALSELCDVSTGRITDLCVDLCHGMRQEAGIISFRDEDFETHLRQRFHPGPMALRGTAAFLKARSQTDPYAAANVADALFRAELHDELVALVLNEREPQVIEDPIERKEAFVRRARFALRAVIDRDDRVQLVKLLFVVAQATKTDREVARLLFENSDLACQFGHPATIQRLYLNEDNDRIGSYGPTHMLCAAHFSRQESTRDLARQHLHSAEAWIRWWSTLPDEDRADWEIGAEDLAHGAEAVFRLFGASQAIKWISRWYPPEWVYRAVRCLARNMIDYDAGIGFSHLEGESVRADVIAAIVDASMAVGITPPASIVQRGIDVWIRAMSHIKAESCKCKNCVVSLCEAAALLNLAGEDLPSVLEHFTPTPPDHTRTYSTELKSSLGGFLKAEALRAVLVGRELSPKMNRLLPESLQQDPDEKGEAREESWAENRRKEFRRCYEIILPAYLLRAARLGWRV